MIIAEWSGKMNRDLILEKSNEIDDLTKELAKGKKVLCKKCGKGYYEPLNNTNTAYCSNPNCKAG